MSSGDRIKKLMSDLSESLVTLDVSLCLKSNNNNHGKGFSHFKKLPYLFIYHSTTLY